MKAHFPDFMANLLKNEHAEIAPSLQQGQEVWYSLLFGVYHPKKPDKIRIVFDSSAPYDGVSLNNVLLTGTDLNNSLLGVLIRFCKQLVTYNTYFTVFWLRRTIGIILDSCGTETMILTAKL